MKRIVFGEPEKFVPSAFDDAFSYAESKVSYPTEEIKFRLNARGVVLEFPIRSEERFYGLGLQLKTFNLTGKSFKLRPNADAAAPTGDSHAPVPFFVSTFGYGIYIDSARNAELDFGRTPPYAEAVTDGKAQVMVDTRDLYRTRFSGGAITVQIPSAKGVTVYVFEGKTITDIVAQYNVLAGGGCTVPEWGLYPVYRCYSRYKAEDILAVADYFTEKNMCVKTLGLEPGWQTRAYSSSFVWDNERFPDPKAFVDEIYDRGFHLNLWEQAFVHPSSPLFEKMKGLSGSYSVWEGAVPDFSLPEAREAFSRYHEKYVSFGKIDGYKLDECDGSDYTGGWTFPPCSEFPSGLDGEQYHMLFGTLFMKAALGCIKDGETFSFVRNAGALCSVYPFALYSDLYGHKDFVRGLCSCGFSGLLWAPEVRHAESAEEFLKRLQTAVFSPHCLINGWYLERLPWIGLGIEKEVKFWLSEREKLIPLLKKAFKLYALRGVPPVRALVSDYTSDEKTYDIDDEYMLGDLLVVPVFDKECERRVYLPEGRWRNYFDKKETPCGEFTAASDSVLVYEKIKKKIKKYKIKTI